MNEIDIKNEIKIYEINGVKVVLDSDLAKVYNFANGTKDINKTIKRNIEKFSNNCIFKLTKEEYDNLRFQSGTSSLEKTFGGRRYNPYVFTKEGVEILSKIIHKDPSKKITKEVVKTFEKNSIKTFELAENTENIRDLIYNIRGKQVMLDFDLARLYNCKNGTKTINLAVKRHLNRFPERFMFQLTEEEYYSILRFQLETLELKQGKYSKYLPYAFTEQGVAMLATVLRTKVAEEVSVNIMDAFVLMKHYIGNNEYRLSNIESKIIEHDRCLKELRETFKKFDEKKKISEIYFNGQIFDAYSKIQTIFNEAHKSLIIIDGYADNTILDMVKRLDINVTIITKPKCLLTNQDIERYNSQYNNLKVFFDDSFHDRYFIIDDKIIYHCGTSVNRIGYRTFSITLLNDKSVTCPLIKKIKSLM